MLTNRLSETGKRILVIDSDESNMGLHKMVGLNKPSTTLMANVGGKTAFMEKYRKNKNCDEESRSFEPLSISDIPSETLSSSGNVSIMEIGKIEHYHEGCACPMGILASDFIDALETTPDEWVLIDTEAGIEHFGRGVGRGVDNILMVADPSEDSALLAEKIRELAKEAAKPFNMVVNKANSRMDAMIRERLSKSGITPVTTIPLSDDVAITNLEGKCQRCDGLKDSIDTILENLK